MGKNYKHLSCEERTMIQLGLAQGCTLRAIARSVQRTPSSISRELKRNGCNNPASVPRRRGRPAVAGGYRALLAQQRADALARTARCPSRLAPDGPLWGYVERLLRECHSPEQIAGILRRMHPDAPTLQVSHETIYTALYAMPRGELRTELIACLRLARKSCWPRAGRRSPRSHSQHGQHPYAPSGKRRARHPRPLGGRSDQGRPQRACHRHPGRADHPVRGLGKNGQCHRRRGSYRLQHRAQPHRRAAPAFLDLRSGVVDGAA